LALFVAGALFAVGLLAVIEVASAVPRRYSPYRKLNVFAKVLTHVENSYVEHVEGTKLVYGAIRGMLSTLDPHSVFMTPEQYRQLKADTQGEFVGLGVEVEIRDGWLTVIAPLDGSPAHRAGLRPGDQIVAIDGASSRDLRMDQALRRLRGPRGTRVLLEVRRSGAPGPLTFEILRDVIKLVSVSTKLLDGGIGYVRVKSFQDRTESQLRAALEKMGAKRKLRGLILDLRNNPGGLLDQAVRVADVFLREGLIVRTTGQGGRTMDEEKAHPHGTFEGFPMVCLVNEGAASAAEIVAGALQDHKRAVVMGARTFGKGSVQTIIELEDDSALKLTVAHYYTPSGRAIQKGGIEPDVIVGSGKAAADEQRRDAGRTDAASATTGSPELDDKQLQTAIDYLRAAQIFRRQSG
jgi:carboxyl-terminal processing protease